MEDVTLAHAKEHLEDLIERATRGEDVRIADPKLGTVRLAPVAGTIAVAAGTRPRIFGQWKDRLPEIPDDRLFAPLTNDELEFFTGDRLE